MPRLKVNLLLAPSVASLWSEVRHWEIVWLPGSRLSCQQNSCDQLKLLCHGNQTSSASSVRRNFDPSKLCVCSRLAPFHSHNSWGWLTCLYGQVSGDWWMINARMMFGRRWQLQLPSVQFSDIVQVGLVTLASNAELIQSSPNWVGDWRKASWRVLLIKVSVGVGVASVSDVVAGVFKRQPTIFVTQMPISTNKIWLVRHWQSEFTHKYRNFPPT